MKCHLFICLGPEYTQLSEVLIVIHCIDMVVGIVFKSDILYLVVGTTSLPFALIGTQGARKHIKSMIVETVDSPCPESFEVGKSI